MMRIQQLLALALCIAALGSAASCGGDTDSRGTDSNTHWLERCTTDGDCGGLSCICGTCSEPCTSDSACEGYAAAAACSPVAGCEMGTTATACVLGCTSDADCGVGSCETGQCRKPAGGSGNIDAGASDGSAPDPCAPMDAEETGDDCAGIVGYRWDGTTCSPIACSCAGSDCPDIFASAGDCDRAYSACHAEKGLIRSCTNHEDCTLVLRNCCGSCGIPQDFIMLALNVDSPTPLDVGLCSGACPDCVTSLNFGLNVACIEDQCELVDLTSYATCAVDGDCRVTSKRCCPCGSEHPPGSLMAVNDSAPQPEWCAVDCEACSVTYPADVTATCEVGSGLCTLTAPP